MHFYSLLQPVLPVSRCCLFLAGLAMGGASLAQTVIPAISTGLSPARAGSITNVVVPGTATAAPSAAATWSMAAPI